MADRLRKEAGSYEAYLCPFHDDRRASFIVYDNCCGCEAGCPVNGREWGDVLDFVMEYFSLHSWREVITTLTGELPEPPKHEKKAASKPARVLSWREIETIDRNIRFSTPYFLGRGLKAETIPSRHLGAYRSWPNTLTIGGQPYTFRAQRFAIPDIAFGRVRNIELRLDEADAWQTYHALPDSLKEQLAEDIQRASREIPAERDLLYEIFGGKYCRVPGGIRSNLIFNAERVWKRVEGGWFSPDMDYVLVHEGSLKALVTEDACDDEFYYPSISAKGARGLSSLVSVKEIIVVQDNEPDKVRPDGTKHNPGREYALKAVEMTGRRLGSGVRIIKAPDGLKAADDAVQAGIVHKWLGELGIEPVRRPA